MSSPFKYRVELNIMKMIFNKLIFDKIKHLIFLLLVVTILTGWECAKQVPAINDSFHTIKGFVQATTFTIKFFIPEPSNITEENLETEIWNRLNVIDLMLSAFNDDSEISRFNRYRGTDWFNVSPETALVVDESLKISRLSEGAFDVTVSPLINLWGFGSASTANSIPSQAVIEKAKGIIGYKNLLVRLSPPALSKNIPELSINLSAIAQGYSVDDIALLLDKKGISSYMVEIGGEIKTKGIKPDGSLWHIGVAAPKKGQEKIQLAIDLDNTSVSTSGDYQNYFIKNGKRYSHEIDPKTGCPITHSLASVTVVNDSCMHADAMATAILVLGPDEGYTLAIKEKLAIYFIIHDSGKFKERMTAQFEKIISGKQ